VEAGVRETTRRIGTFTFAFKDKTCNLVLIGKDTPAGVQPVAHVRDLTSGPEAPRPEHSRAATSTSPSLSPVDRNARHRHAVPAVSGH
jgi:hypothetical protein